MKTVTNMSPIGFTNMVFNHLFDELIDGECFSTKDVLYNIVKKDDGYELEFNVAGYAKDKFKVDVDERQLMVSYVDTKSDTESGKNYVFKSFTDKSFKKVFNLTDINVGKIKAKHDDGILRIVLPKLKDKVSRNIEVE